jgi:hypothetical protein
MLKRLFMLALAAALLGGCTHVIIAKSIKLVGFDDTVKKGRGGGEIEGEDCIHTILGYRLGGSPDVGRAIRSATQGNGNPRYMNNLRVEPDGFDIGIYARDCYVARGLAVK